MRLLLLKTGGRQRRFDLLIPDLGLAEVAGIARRSGADVKLFDLDLLGCDLAECYEYIKTFKPTVIGLKLFSSNVYFAEQLARQIKIILPHVTIIGGGPQATLFGSTLLKQLVSFDILVRGPANISLPLLLQAVSNESRYEDIPALCWREGQEIKETPRHTPSSSTPVIPQWDIYDFERYLPIGLVSLVRGCPLQCPFCSHNAVWATGGRGRDSTLLTTATLLQNNIDQLQSTGGITKFALVDSFPVVREIDVFCRLLAQLVTKPRWLAFGHIGAMGDRFRKYSASGCTALWYGIESGHEKSRRSLGKSFTNEMVLEDITRTSEAGIWAGAGFMFGYPTESKEAFHESISLASKLPANSVCWSPFTVDPDTPMATYPLQHGVKLAEDWLERIACLPDGITPSDVPYFTIDGEWNSDLCLKRGREISYLGGGEDRTVANLDYVALTITGSGLNETQFLNKLQRALQMNDPAKFALLRRSLV